MSKLFIESTIWDDPEIQNLESKHKLFWIYILCKSNCAGIWKPNISLASFQIGKPLNTSEIIRIFKKHIIVLDNGNWFIKNYIKFQCGNLSSKCPAHKPIITELMKYYDDSQMSQIFPKRLLNRLSNRVTVRVSNNLQEKEKEKEIEKEKEKESFLGKSENPFLNKPSKAKFKKPTIEEIQKYCTERKNSINANNFFNFYESKGWMVGKNKMKDWKAAVRTWENNPLSKSTKTESEIEEQELFENAE